MFDTYKTSDKLHAFIDEFEHDTGDIVIAACKDECKKNLSPKAMDWLTKLGSNEIKSLGYRCAFAFIGVNSSGEKTAHENVAVNQDDHVSIE